MNRLFTQWVPTYTLYMSSYGIEVGSLSVIDSKTTFARSSDPAVRRKSSLISPLCSPVTSTRRLTQLCIQNITTSTRMTEARQAHDHVCLAEWKWFNRVIIKWWSWSTRDIHDYDLSRAFYGPIRLHVPILHEQEGNGCCVYVSPGNGCLIQLSGSCPLG